MTKTLKLLKYYTTSLVIYFLISIGIYAFYCESDCFTDWRDVANNLSFGMVIAFALSEGNGRLSGYLDKKYSWIDQTFMRVLSGVVILVLYSVLATIVVGYLYIVWILGFPASAVPHNYLKFIDIFWSIQTIKILWLVSNEWGLLRIGWGLDLGKT